MSDWSAESDLFAAGRFAFGPATGRADAARAAGDEDVGR